MSLAITANAEESALKIQAAIDNLPSATKRLMAQAGISLNGKKTSVAEVDRLIMAAARPLDPVSRIELKLQLDRAGLLS
jgi:hypothetical protein